jgi:hypothetical protein
MHTFVLHIIVFTSTSHFENGSYNVGPELTYLNVLPILDKKFHILGNAQTNGKLIGVRDKSLNWLGHIARVLVGVSVDDVEGVFINPPLNLIL